MPLRAITCSFLVNRLYFGDLDTWVRASPTTYPARFELHSDALYPIPQLHSINFDYIRAPHLNDAVLEAPHLSSVLTVPPNPSPVLATQLASKFTDHDRLLGVNMASPGPNVRGRSPFMSTSAARTPGAGPSNCDRFILGFVVYCFGWPKFQCPSFGRSGHLSGCCQDIYVFPEREATGASHRSWEGGG